VKKWVLFIWKAKQCWHVEVLISICVMNGGITYGACWKVWEVWSVTIKGDFFMTHVMLYPMYAKSCKYIMSFDMASPPLCKQLQRCGESSINHGRVIIIFRCITWLRSLSAQHIGWQHITHVVLCNKKN
jgi:hypothetical protein